MWYIACLPQAGCVALLYKKNYVDLFKIVVVINVGFKNRWLNEISFLGSYI